MAHSSLSIKNTCFCFIGCFILTAVIILSVLVCLFFLVMLFWGFFFFIVFIINKTKKPHFRGTRNHVGLFPAPLVQQTHQARCSDPDTFRILDWEQKVWMTDVRSRRSWLCSGHVLLVLCWENICAENKQVIFSACERERTSLHTSVTADKCV